jgi:hypothetical protein
MTVTAVLQSSALPTELNTLCRACCWLINPPNQGRMNRELFQDVMSASEVHAPQAGAPKQLCSEYRCMTWIGSRTGAHFGAF